MINVKHFENELEKEHSDFDNAEKLMAEKKSKYFEKHKQIKNALDELLQRQIKKANRRQFEKDMKQINDMLKELDEL